MIILAQVAAGWSIANLIVALIVIAAAIGILFVVLRVAGIAIPAWAVQIFWIVLVAFVAIFAIRLLFSF